MTSVTVEATNPPSLNSTFEANIPNIYVPAGSVDAYKAASGWSTYADNISAMA